MLHSLPTMSRNIVISNTAVCELGFVPGAKDTDSLGYAPPNKGPQQQQQQGQQEQQPDAGAAAAAAAVGGGEAGRAAAPGAAGSSGGDGGAWRVVRVNDTSHLPSHLVT